MDRGDVQAVMGFDMFWLPVAYVFFKTVARVKFCEFAHQPVSIALCGNLGGYDRQYQGVAVNNGGAMSAVSLTVSTRK